MSAAAAGQGEDVFVTARDGVRVPLTWFAAQQPRWALLFLPALGIKARFYTPLARALSAQACSVCLMEQRGHGRSPLRAGRRTLFGMDEYLQQDIPASLQWMGERSPGLPVVLGGHSLGAHLSTIFAGQHPQWVQGIVHVACGSPYHGDFPRRQARLIRMLCRLVPLFRVFPGYFPGPLVGFAGRESILLMEHWRQWASTGRLDFGAHGGLGEAAAAYRGPVLAIGMEHDMFSSAAAEQRAIAPFRNARVEQLRLGTAEQGRHLGHFDWAREPGGVAARIRDWLQRELNGR